MTLYRCILMDPPWPEKGAGKIKRGADRHYHTMTPRQIYQTIIAAPEYRPADDGHLWMWATDNYLDAALAMMARLQFRYVRTLVWVKLRDSKIDSGDLGRSCIDIAEATMQIGLGQYARGSHELLLFGTRGKAHVPPPENRGPSVIFAPRTKKHSEKPREFHRRIESISPEPRLEMFARDAEPGWDVWGDQAPTGPIDERELHEQADKT